MSGDEVGWRAGGRAGASRVVGAYLRQMGGGNALRLMVARRRSGGSYGTSWAATCEGLVFCVAACNEGQMAAVRLGARAICW